MHSLFVDTGSKLSSPGEYVKVGATYIRSL
jgi:hypothetical protein